MDAKYLRGNYGGNREAVKDVNESFPDFDVTTTFAFVVKPINCQRKCQFL